jgi:hypothetical protein
VKRPGTCALSGFIAVWALAVYLPALVIGYAGWYPAAAAIGHGFDQLFRTTFTVADWMSPWAKLILGGAIAAAFFSSLRLAAAPARTAAATAGTMLAMLLLLAFLPEPLSRGFGIGIAGARFDPALVAAYLIGAGIAGAIGMMLRETCLKRG